ncbi:type II secretion system protein N [Ectothiorhodospira lacustris]|uniref:type II secretion system protein N n=1 Tax=Ectothiorhodospira lacustris TaxID=2899127 RepID=UPI001EE8D011|nr:type II secretion system protein N [Ectothiorhodospira lacustris]MCG5510266.1 type II secretion system protein N [Ectothiorhodospira lacustris]MCG5521867.1 type II secretion system protein N [Ectothiorhodospira lacustris]
MRRLFLSLLFSLSLLAILLPASVWVAAQVPLTPLQAFADRHLPMPEPLARLNIEGSLGRGQVTQVVFPGTAGADLGAVDLSWKLRPMQAVTGRIAADVEAHFDGGRFEGVASRSLAGWRITEGQGQLPAARLERILEGAGLQGVGLDGTVRLDLRRLDMTDDGQLQSAGGQLEWHHAAILADRPIPLGQLSGRFHAEGDRFQGTLRDQGGPLALQGRVTGDLRRGRVQFEAVATPRDRNDSALIGMLAEVGEAQGDGFVIRFQRP